MVRKTSRTRDFDLNTEPNMDLIITQSVSTGQNGQLPPEVTRYGPCEVGHALAGWWLVLATAPRRGVLSNMSISISTSHRPLLGGGRVEVFGPASMRFAVWIKPDQLASCRHHRKGITNAIQAQSKEIGWPDRWRAGSD